MGDRVYSETNRNNSTTHFTAINLAFPVRKLNAQYDPYQSNLYKLRKNIMAEPSMHFGIIGCANIARKVARAINLAPNSVLHAIASRSIEKAKQFAIQNGFSDCVKIYGSYTEILDDPVVDVVYIPLPTTLHVQWAVMAAQKKKHLLLEKPTALDVEELDKILEACESNGVQFMDGSMWLHHPRTIKLKEFITDSQLLGQLNFIHSSSTISSSSEFIENDIRVKPDMDSLGALGDLGWYCIGAILWAKDYQIPTSVTALPGIVKNSAGVILSFTASFHYNQADKTTFATIDCSFLSHTSMDLAICGSNRSLSLHDYIIPFQETSASFEFTPGARFAELHIGWNMKPEKVEVVNELPQEALMVQGLSRIVQNIKNSRGHPEAKWPEISRKTQLVLDAVKRSIDLGCKTVHL